MADTGREPDGAGDAAAEMGREPAGEAGLDCGRDPVAEAGLGDPDAEAGFGDSDLEAGCETLASPNIFSPLVGDLA